METVAIVGVGLIGASFGLALRKSGFTGEIIGVSSPGALSAGLARGAISTSASLKEAAGRSDLIYLAQPVDRIIETIRLLAPLLRMGCLVTDAGSTKTRIVQQAAISLPEGTFVGGHPMAGKEQRGPEGADADLFRDRPYVITPPDSAAWETRVALFERVLVLIGAKVTRMTPEEHDRTVALTSHLPQLVSTALAATLARRADPGVQKVFGPGLLDMTRLALSPSELWLSILETNREEIRIAIDEFLGSLKELRDDLGTGKMEHTFSEASSFGRSIRVVNTPY